MRYIWKIIKFSGSLWRYYLGIAGFTVVVGLLGLVRPILFGEIIDTITKAIASQSAVDTQRMVTLGVMIFAADLATNILGNLGGYIGDQMTLNLKRLLSERYYDKLLGLPQSYFDNELTGTIINRLTRTIDNITRFMQMMSNNFISLFLTIFLSAIYIARYSWPVTALILLLVPVYFLMTRRTSTRWQDYEKEINQEMDQASGRFAEVVSQIKVVKSFVQERRERSFFQKRFSKSKVITQKQSVLWHQQDAKRKLLLNLVFFMMYAYMIFQATHGTLTAGQFTTIILMINTLSFPLTSLGFIVENAQRAIAGSRDYFAVMALPAAAKEDTQTTTLQVKSGAIVFDDVYFKYDDTPVLRGVSLRVEPNTKTALVGESGEGKTTITNLLLGLYQPQKGSITIDGQSIGTVSQMSLRSSIGIVFQDAALFSGTIRENISYARPDATKKEIIAAAKAANADDFINKLEKGYDSFIGERGVKLSGGQKQRIAIARAILKDSPILILDEATSSLDSKSEAEVQQALERLMQGRTTIIIAHRLSTIANVDQIITLKAGQIDEVGTPQKLASSGGIYSQLLKLQQGDSEQSKKKLQSFEMTV